MKRSHLLLLFAIFCASNSFAQRLDVFAGLNSSGFKQELPGTQTDGTGNFGYHYGMSVYVPFKANRDDLASGYGVYPSLMYIKKGTSNANILGAARADVKINYLQLNLPLTYYTTHAGIGIGAYSALALSGQKKYRVGTGAKEKIDLGNELKKSDYGVSLDFTVSFFKFRYDLGLANIATGANGTVKTRNFSLSFVIPLVEQ